MNCVGVLRRPEIILIAGFLLIDGGFGVVGLATLIPFTQGGGLPIDFDFTMIAIGEIAAKTIFFTCGLLLIKRPPRLIPVLWTILAVSIFDWPRTHVLHVARMRAWSSSGIVMPCVGVMSRLR